MIKEAIVLAGGLGTRLKGVINDIPKPMAPIGAIPFLEYLLVYLENEGIERVILAVGYKYQVIEEYFGNKYKTIDIVYAVENEPMGTGGGIANALKHTNNQQAFLLNGDTFFEVNLNALNDLHTSTEADLTLSLKELSDFDRYGTVELSGNKITSFKEKAPVTKGFINGGVYIINKKLFMQDHLGSKFSFEQDVMESGVDKFNINGLICNGYFIDIGIPSDYEKAASDLPKRIKL